MLQSKIGTFTTTTNAKTELLLDINSLVGNIGTMVTIKSIYLQVTSNDTADKTITTSVSNGVTDVGIHTHDATAGSTTYAKIENGDALVRLGKNMPLLKVAIPALTSTKIVTINYVVNYF